MSSTKSSAIKYVKDKFASALKKPSIYWPTVPHKNLEWEILKRIEDPDRIWQGTSNLCGMASFMNSLAYKDPYLYGYFVCGLLKNGSAYLGYTKDSPVIKPSKATRSSKVPPSMPTADWVALSSLRDHLNQVLHYSFDVGVPTLKDIPLIGLFGTPKLVEAVGGITWPKDLPPMLEAVGYTNIVNRADVVVRPDQSVWGELHHYYSHGYRVLLLINTAIFQPDAGKFSSMPNHWVRMAGRVHQTGSKVRVLVYDPAAGGLRWLPQSKSGASLPLSAFWGNFWGFVAARK